MKGLLYKEYGVIVLWGKRNVVGKSYASELGQEDACLHAAFSLYNLSLKPYVKKLNPYPNLNPSGSLLV